MKLKRIIAITTCIFAVVGMNGCSSGSNTVQASKNATAAVTTTVQQKVKTGFYVDYVENLVANTYDIDLYVDDSKIGSFEQGDGGMLEKSLEPGSYTITVRQSDDVSNYDKKSITIGEDEICYILSCKATWSGIEIQSFDSMSLNDARNSK